MYPSGIVEESPESSSTDSGPPKSGLAVVYRSLSELKPNPKNPRCHSRQQIRQIAKSISAFGFNVPVLVDGDLNVVAGHGRIEACRQLGWTSVPTILLAHLTSIQVKAFVIADNRLTENSEWNDGLLAEQLKELSLLNLDFELDVTGFALAEIDLRIDSLNADSGGDDPLDQVPAATGSAVTHPGDLWYLGRHRLLCGSALDAASYARLLDGEKAGLAFTDPPYNVAVQGHVSGKGTITHREFAMASGEMTQAEFTDFLRQACLQLAAHSVPGSIHYLCMDWRHVGELLAAGNNIYAELLNVCVWVKHNGGMGSLYRSQHEFVFVFKNGAASHCNNVELGNTGATAPMCGIIAAPTILGGQRRRATSSRCTRQ